MIYQYKMKGTCAGSVSFDLHDDQTVTDISFVGGCNGNLKAVSLLCEGMKAEDIIVRLSGVTCGWKNTSCPDQFADGLIKAMEKQQEEKGEMA